MDGFEIGMTILIGAVLMVGVGVVRDAWRTVTDESQRARERETARKIASFKDLPDGWHFGIGCAPSEETIKRALLLDREARHQGFQRTGAFPGINGEIQVTIYHEETYLEFMIEPDGSVMFVWEHDSVEIREERMTFNDALRVPKQVRLELDIKTKGRQI